MRNRSIVLPTEELDVAFADTELGEDVAEAAAGGPGNAAAAPFRALGRAR